MVQRRDLAKGVGGIGEDHGKAKAPIYRMPAESKQQTKYAEAQRAGYGMGTADVLRGKALSFKQDTQCLSAYRRIGA